MLVGVLSGFALVGSAQSDIDTQRQYQEQQKQHLERQLDEQRRLDEQRNHDTHMHELERDRDRYGPQTQRSGTTPASSSLDLVAVAAAIAAAATLLSSREPQQVDQARAYKQLAKRRKWLVWESCKNNARTQAAIVVGSKPQLADEFWLQADTVCHCFASRSVVAFSEPELQNLLPFHAGTTWAKLPTARVQEVLAPCGIRSTPTDLLNVAQLANVDPASVIFHR